ncbi:ExeA family protein [Neptunomonas phycophila]|jgi:type II secretory pathway predicted ATPase ExeA|uniref:ExeA family protein n=1 Tax=Neptunomonas phycophila TaxID=1572645 RepID=UPI0009490059|nr:AAA family ATPase [Neptunomonas phycophila]
MTAPALTSIEEFYQFSSPPFRLTPDPHYIYQTQSFIHAKRTLQQFITTDDGILLIDAQPGLGKTILLQHFSELPLTKIKAFFIQCFNLSSDELFETIVFALHLKPEKTKSKNLMLISLYCKRLRKQGFHPILILDEVNSLPSETLRELGLLMSINLSKSPLFQLILSGTPQINDSLSEESLQIVKDKILHRISLGPLKRQEVQAYIDHRLALAGGNPPTLPSQKAGDYLFRFSGGVPRIINLIIYRLLLLGTQEKKHELAFIDFHKVIHELKNEGLLPHIKS